MPSNSSADCDQTLISKVDNEQHFEIVRKSSHENDFKMSNVKTSNSRRKERSLARLGIDANSEAAYEKDGLPSLGVLCRFLIFYRKPEQDAVRQEGAGRVNPLVMLCRHHTGKASHPRISLRSEPKDDNSSLGCR